MASATRLHGLLVNTYNQLKTVEAEVKKGVCTGLFDIPRANAQLQQTYAYLKSLGQTDEITDALVISLGKPVNLADVDSLAAAMDALASTITSNTALAVVDLDEQCLPFYSALFSDLKKAGIPEAIEFVLSFVSEV